MAAPAPLAAPPPLAEPASPRDHGRRPAVLVAYRAAQPCPHQAYYGATPVQAVRALAERLALPLERLGFRAGPLGEVDVFDRYDTTAPTLAAIEHGLSVAETRSARAWARYGDRK
jgi:hypothetical protein